MLKAHKQEPILAPRKIDWKQPVSAPRKIREMAELDDKQFPDLLDPPAAAATSPSKDSASDNQPENESRHSSIRKRALDNTYVE